MPRRWIYRALKKLAALDWDRMITGHPYAGGRFGTKKDVQATLRTSKFVGGSQTAADAGKCFDRP